MLLKYLNENLERDTPIPTTIKVLGSLLAYIDLQEQSDSEYTYALEFSQIKKEAQALLDTLQHLENQAR